MLTRRVLIIGATGGTGRHLLDQALDAGHHVTAFVRNPARLTRQHEHLHVVSGSLPGDVAMLTQAVRGQDVVVSAIGRGTSLKSEQLMQRCVPLLLATMKSERVSRLLYLSAIGVGDTFRYAPLFSKLLIRTLLRDIYADKIVAERLVKGSELDWTIVQPAQLTDGPLTRQYRSGEGLRLSGVPKVSRADVAHFMVRELADGACMRTTVLMGY